MCTDLVKKQLDFVGLFFWFFLFLFFWFFFVLVFLFFFCSCFFVFFVFLCFFGFVTCVHGHYLKGLKDWAC